MLQNSDLIQLYYIQGEMSLRRYAGWGTSTQIPVLYNATGRDCLAVVVAGQTPQNVGCFPQHVGCFFF